MFGHVDGPVSWAQHIVQLRRLQRITGGFTEFVPLPFVHMQAPIYLKGMHVLQASKLFSMGLWLCHALLLHPAFCHKPLHLMFSTLEPAVASPSMHVSCKLWHVLSSTAAHCHPDPAYLS